jgi:hypothetical protein
MATVGLSQVAFASGSDQYVGIGVTVHQDKDAFQIIDMNPSGPAINSGVNLNDWITAVDAKPVKGIKLDELVALIKGPIGTTVVLTLEDDKTHTAHDVSIVRAQVTVVCVLQGNYNLNFFGTAQSGSISGFVGQDNVFLNVFSNMVTGNIGNEYVSLRLDGTPGFEAITGFIHGTYITWRASGTTFFGYQDCIVQ